MTDDWTPKPKPPLGTLKRVVTCCCRDVEGAASADCWSQWMIEADAQPDTFCRDPICPPCLADVRKTLALLKAKGVNVSVKFQDE